MARNLWIRSQAQSQSQCAVLTITPETMRAFWHVSTEVVGKTPAVTHSAQGIHGASGEVSCLVTTPSHIGELRIQHLEARTPQSETNAIANLNGLVCHAHTASFQEKAARVEACSGGLQCDPYPRPSLPENVID